MSGEIEHFQALDKQKLAQEHQENLAKIKADGAVRKLEEQRKAAMAKWFRRIVTPILAFGVLTGATIGIIAVATSGPAKTPEQITIEKKQDRWKACITKESWSGEPLSTWWPEAANGDGLCLPRGQEPPK